MANPLNTDVPLSVGQLFYATKNGMRTCPFQFNPTELERSRNITATRTPTGNTLEEPGAGERNQAKRKASRKPEPWSLTLSLKFDAGHAPIYKQPPPPPTSAAEAIAFAEAAASTIATLAANQPSLQNPTAQRVLETIQFFESLAEPLPEMLENDQLANADETPPPPFLTLAFGSRAWRCAVKSVRIKEEDYTHDLYPRRCDVSLTLEILETVRQAEQAKGTAA